jgi:hypothetical protein
MSPDDQIDYDGTSYSTPLSSDVSCSPVVGRNHPFEDDTTISTFEPVDKKKLVSKRNSIGSDEDDGTESSPEITKEASTLTNSMQNRGFQPYTPGPKQGRGSLIQSGVASPTKKNSVPGVVGSSSPGRTGGKTKKLARNIATQNGAQDDLESGIHPPESDYASQKPPDTAALWQLTAPGMVTPGDDSDSIERIYNEGRQRNLHPPLYYDFEGTRTVPPAAGVANSTIRRQQDDRAFSRSKYSDGSSSDKASVPGRRSWVILTCVACLLVSGIVVVAVLMTRDKSGTNSTPFETFKKSLSSDQRILYDVVVSTVVESDSLLDESTPQNQALQWLLFTDPMFTADPAALSPVPENRIKQRFVLATFFYSVNGTSWNQDHNWLVSNECLSTFWRGVDCNDDDEVRTIALGKCASE